MQVLHNSPDSGGVFAIGEGVAITDDGDVELTGASSLRAERDKFDLVGTHLELCQGTEVTMHVLLDPEEAKALGEALVASAQEIESGAFEDETRKRIAAEHAAR